MGGAGKTTLARAVYDQISIQFEGSSFVENVREVSNGSSQGLKCLQEQVLCDVLKDRSIRVSGVSDGKLQMKRMLCTKKVLVVLDDVDHIEHLKALVGEPNWFKKGSRIIITTRDEQVLVAHGVNFNFDVNLLSNKEAICLFSRYAFGTEIPIQGYKELAEKVVHYAAGLPLTICVLGSFLCGKSDDVWTDAIERLKTIPLKETLEKLELSYNSLENDYKEIFLDVACILKGWEKDRAIKALESLGFHAKNGLNVLEKKSLITISWNGYLGMHDHIEEMGKNIVRRLHLDEPHKHNRLWIREEIEDVLDSGLGSEATRCIYFWNDELHPRTSMKGLVNMKKLRFLVVRWNNMDFDEASQYLPNDLQFLIWNGDPWFTKNFPENNTVGLEMRDSSVVQLWEPGERKVLKKLKFMELSYSMLRILDLLLFPNLEVLILQNCDGFVELDIRFLCQKLRFINLSGSKLRFLYLGPNPNLEVLDLDHCEYLEQLHMQGESAKLKSLDLTSTNLMSLDLGLTPNLELLELPNGSNLVEFHMRGESSKLESLELSFPELKTLNLVRSPKLKTLIVDLPGSILRTLDLMRTPNLENLWVKGSNNLEELGSFLISICTLRCLRSLELEGSFPELPTDLHQLECLEELDFSCPMIKHLPNSICMLKHLKEFSLYCCELLEQLPEDLGRLECLEELCVTECKMLRDIPNSICELKCLEYINLRDCILLEKLPEELGSIECLTMLCIEGTGIRHLPQSISRLERLNMYECLNDRLTLIDMKNLWQYTESEILDV